MIYPSTLFTKGMQVEAAINGNLDLIIPGIIEELSIRDTRNSWLVKLNWPIPGYVWPSTVIEDIYLRPVTSTAPFPFQLGVEE